MREIVKALSSLEAELERRYGVTLNQAMVLCCIGHERVTSTAISENIGLTPSNTSKLLRSMEEKSLITRTMGHDDRRCIYYSITPEGLKRLHALKTRQLPIPPGIAPLFS